MAARGSNFMSAGVVRAAKWEILQYLCVAGCVPRKRAGIIPHKSCPHPRSAAVC